VLDQDGASLSEEALGCSSKCLAFVFKSSPSSSHLLESSAEVNQESKEFKFKVQDQVKDLKIKAQFFGVLCLDTVNEEVMNASCLKLVTVARHLSEVARLRSHH